jgi:hypothetical protein
MQTRDNGKQAAEEKIDLDLENIVGNLLIAEYQVDKLHTRLANLVCSYDYDYDYDYGYRPQMSNNKASIHVFKHNNKWYKVSLRIDETDTNGNKDGQDYMI